MYRIETEKFTISRNDSFMEGWPDLILLKSGRIAVFLREDSWNGNNGFIVFSDDLGRSFYGLREIPVKGMHRPAVGYLASGDILLSYREHPSREVRYRDLKMCILAESEVADPDTMKPEFHLLDHDGSEDPDGGYSAWVQLPDGTVLMANYIVDDAPKAYIRGYRIQIGGNDA